LVLLAALAVDRQWGRHATAFVGRRHFDEARPMQHYFRLRME
jgi:hypothetical protein